MMNRFLFLVFSFWGILTTVKAQDLRVADYEAVPLTINPALTGNFDGLVRITAHQVQLSSDLGKNSFTNASVDFKLGYNRQWGLGINFFNSGNKDFQVSSKALSLSLSREMYFDSYGVSTLRVGVQTSFNEGLLDEDKPNYSTLLDAGILRIPIPENRPVGLPPQYIRKSYTNFGAGLLYRFNENDMHFETGLAAYSFTKPKNSPFFPNVGKRMRLAVHSNFSYDISDRTRLGFNYLLWQERIFLVGYNEADLEENAPIKEDIFGITLTKTSLENSVSFQLAERSYKTLIGNVGFRYRDTFELHVAYEHPLNKTYYDIQHFETGIRIFLNKE